LKRLTLLGEALNAPIRLPAWLVLAVVAFPIWDGLTNMTWTTTPFIVVFAVAGWMIVRRWETRHPA
jgi:hypothetical protein